MKPLEGQTELQYGFISTETITRSGKSDLHPTMIFHWLNSKEALRMGDLKRRRPDSTRRNRLFWTILHPLKWWSVTSFGSLNNPSVINKPGAHKEGRKEDLKRQSILWKVDQMTFRSRLRNQKQIGKEMRFPWSELTKVAFKPRPRTRDGCGPPCQQSMISATFLQTE